MEFPSAKSFGAAVAALSLMIGSTTSAAAPMAVRAVDPLVVLSVLGSAESHAAICAVSAASMTVAAQGGAPPGCVLPVADQAALVTDAGPPPAVLPPAAPAGAYDYGAGKAFAYLLGGGFLVLALALLAWNGGDEDSESPG